MAEQFVPIPQPDLAAIMARLQEASAALEEAKREIARQSSERKE
jgi:hypothetical protein